MRTNYCTTKYLSDSLEYRLEPVVVALAVAVVDAVSTQPRVNLTYPRRSVRGSELRWPLGLESG